ncbi:MAG: alkaline phosphatase family protein [Kofleriaceae bacterium]|nr:alkaline phosphatase family protein [Kofleriaceae bacterium]
MSTPPASIRAGGAARVTLALALAAALLAAYWWLPDARRAFIKAVVSADGVARPDAAPHLPRGPTPATVAAPTPSRVRVVLIDGVDRASADRMPAWRALCARGQALTVDVGFPTVSLPVQSVLWTGLVQQQTGVVFHSGARLDPPLGATAIPAQVPGSVAVAEAYPYIVHSLGFARTEPAEFTGSKVDAAWTAAWQERALAAVTGPARLAFVHILRVDTAGHKFGGASAEYHAAVDEADAILAELVAAAEASAQAAPPGGAPAPGGDPAPALAPVRWLVLSDHGHLPGGGHGGEEEHLRVVRACVVGPGVAAGAAAATVHLVDVARDLADAVGAVLPAAARGRPLAEALAHPGFAALPTLPIGRVALALLLLALGVGATAWGMRGRLRAAPWWFPLALGLVLISLGTPTLSTPFIYKPTGRDLYLAFWPALALLAVGAGLAARDRAPLRLVAAQLALPAAALLAALLVCGGEVVFVGATAAPVVPRYTAWVSPLFLMVAQACGVVALAALATLVPPRSDRAAPPGTRRSAP